MANITLGNLRDIWQGILNWVNGTDAVSIPKVQVMGSNVISANLLTLASANVPTQLPNIPCREITIIGLKNNAGTVYVGGANVAIVLNPTAAPTLTTATTGGSLAAATYYVKYTWVNANGDTIASPESSITTTGTTSTITVTLPTLPAGVTSANVYISTATGTETKQGNTTTTSYTQSSALTTGTTLPAKNTATVYGAAFDAKDSQTFPVNNANMIYIYGTAGDGVSYVAV